MLLTAVVGQLIYHSNRQREERQQEQQQQQEQLHGTAARNTEAA
jgi:hypothetical protein